MASRFWVGGAGTWDASDTTHWAATSGGAGGQTVPGSGDTVTLDGSSGGGTVTVNTNFTVTSITMGAFTGTLDFATNNNSPTMATFSGTGTGTRTLNMGNGTWTLTGNNATIWNFGTITNLTLSRGSSVIVSNYSGSVGTRTFVHTDTGETTCPSINVTAGTDTITFNATRLLNLNLTGFAGTLGTGTFVLWGNLTIPSGVTVAATGNPISFAATSGTKTITTNGVTINRPITLIAPGATIQLSDSLTLGSTRTFTLSNGTFTANNFNVTVGAFSSSNSNTRTINMGSGTWALTGTGTVFNLFTGTNLTMDTGTATIRITDTSSTAKQTNANTYTYQRLEIPGGGAGQIDIVNHNQTYREFSILGPKTLNLGVGLTFLNSVEMMGSAGNLVTIVSNVAGTLRTLSKSSGTVISDYLSLTDSSATGGATWYAGANSTNVSNNRGWQFSNQDAGKGNFFQVM